MFYRCNRLKKDCNVQVIARQPKAPRMTCVGYRSSNAAIADSVSSHVAQIEKKLDGLMSLLNASHHLPSNSPFAPDSILISDAPSNTLPVTADTSSTLDSTQSPAVGLDHPACSQPESTPPLPKTSFSYVIDEAFSQDEADMLVNVYRRDLAAQSPFVIVPNGLTAQELHRDTPFLFYSILFAASYDDSSRQRLLEHEIVKYFSEHSLLYGQRNLDLLQGLLLYITWYVI